MQKIPQKGKEDKKRKYFKWFKGFANKIFIPGDMIALNKPFCNPVMTLVEII
jgi:hypothetical protein